VRVQLAELDRHLIGFAQVALDSPHPLAPAGRQAELCRIYVQQPFAGQGVGRALLGWSEQCALEAGASVLWLTAWEHNRRALAFYARRGYRDCGASVYRFKDESHGTRVLAKRLGAAVAQAI
jgi:GNAT superfamily N-acetyltransferase